MVAVLVGVTACGGDASTTTTAAPPVDSQVTSLPAPTEAASTEPLKYAAAPDMVIDPASDYTAEVVTNLGTISIDLFEETAPTTVNNFVFLAREGFYDGVIFHRIVPDFVIQGGDPTGTGAGGPGYTFDDELNDPRAYTRGIVAMANAGPDTNGSQFFIMLADVGLPYQYSIFGEVTDGLDVVDTIASTELTGERPVEDVVIESVTVDGP